MTGAINADKAVQDGLRKAQTTLGSNNYALLTEHGMAAAFTERYKDELRYDHKAGCWFLWTGTHWQEDCKHRAFSYARMLVAEANQLCEQKEQAITGKASFCGGVERFARTDPAHAVVPEDWDKDPYLLATPGGTVDLRTGALRPACPADMITRVAAVAPSDMPYPQWERFLNEATNIEPPASCLINVLEHRLMIPNDGQLELRLEGKVILPHKSCCNWVTAGHLLDAAFGPCPALFRF